MRCVCRLFGTVVQNARSREVASDSLYGWFGFAKRDQDAAGDLLGQLG